MDSTKCNIPLSRPDLDEATVQAVASVLRSPTLSLGPRLESFERAFARRLGTRYAVGVSSGTAGLHLAVRILGLGEGDEVVTSPFSFIASSNCLLFERVRPVFVDIDPDTFVMDPALVEGAVTSRTRAILPVHIFGNPADMPVLMDIARSRGLHVIEDACEAIGGKFHGRMLGSWGDLGVFGFYPNKQITTGEGGMVVTSREDWAVRMRSLRNQGRSPSGDGTFSEVGYNYRLSEVAAALGECQLERLDSFLECRREKERRYRELLQNLDEVHVPPVPESRSPFVFILQTREPSLKDHLRSHLAERGIQTGLYFRPIHLEVFYRRRFGFREGDFPRAEHAGRTCLALPFHNRITEREQLEVARAVESAVTSWLKARRASTTALRSGA